MKVLLKNTVVTSGTRMIYTQYTPMDCTISGCYEEGWFFYRYAIAPAHLTCPPFIQNTTHSGEQTTSHIQILTSILSPIYIYIYILYISPDFKYCICVSICSIK